MADDLKHLIEGKEEANEAVRLIDLWHQLADLEKRVAVLENRGR